MFSWTPYAFVRFLLFFVSGILLGIYFPEVLPENITEVAFLLFTVGFVVIAFLRSTNVSKVFNPGPIALVALFLAGYIRVFYATDACYADHILNYSDSIQYYKAIVIKHAQEKENSWKVEAMVTAVQNESKLWQKRSGKVLLYLSKKAYRNPYQYGDVLLIEGSPKILTEPSNPGEFDYKRFLTFKKIYHQHFLRDGEVFLLGNQPPNVLIDYSIRARVWAEEALKRNVKGEREQAIASALVLGVTDGLDNELLNAYSATGAMHVLAVSGLHVGIIYWLILLILKPLNKTTTGKWLLAVISVTVLWSYAFITGLSPSVLRAVTMFSFVALARPWGQRTNIYNTLAASAFCLLLFEPYLIMSVGFQLSYLAVIGIVYLQPMLYRWWEPDHVLWDRVWQITCVSIAAQVATFSLGLLYFHQFPVYFLFSNLFVIPGSFAVLVLGILVIAVSVIQPVALVIGFLLEWTIRLLNMGVFSVEDFPYSLIDNVYITTAQCWLLMLTIAAVILLVEFKKFSYALIAFFCVMGFSIIQWNHFTQEVDQQKLVVYRVAGHSALDIVDRGKAYFFADSILIHNQEKMRFHIRPTRLLSGVSRIHSGEQQDFVREVGGCRILQWNGVTILQLTEKEFTLPDTLEVDYVVVGKNSIKSLKALSSVKFKSLILDSSNSFYFAERIMKEAQSFSVRVHSVIHSGAFIAKLSKK